MLNHLATEEMENLIDKVYKEESSTENNYTQTFIESMVGLKRNDKLKTPVQERVLTNVEYVNQS